MRPRPTLLAFVAVAMALAVAQTTRQEPSFADTAGRFAVHGVKKPLISGNPSEGKIHIDFIGDPLSGFSKDQGLEFRARHAVGDLKTQGSGFSVQNFTLEGDVWLKVAGKSAAPAKEGATTPSAPPVTEVTSSKIVLVDGADQATVDSPGALKLTSSVGGADSRKIILKGPNAKITMDPLTKPSDDAVRTVVMSGKTTVDVDTVAKSVDGTVRKVSMTVTGDQLRFDRTTREITLSGHVHVTGRSTSDSAGITGTLDAEVFTLQLTKDHEVVGWTLGKGSGSFDGKAKDGG